MWFAGSDTSWPSTFLGSLSCLDISLSVSTQFLVWLEYCRISSLGNTLYPLPNSGHYTSINAAQDGASLVPPVTQDTKFVNR